MVLSILFPLAILKRLLSALQLWLRYALCTAFKRATANFPFNSLFCVERLPAFRLKTLGVDKRDSQRVLTFGTGLSEAGSRVERSIGCMCDDGFAGSLSAPFLAWAREVDQGWQECGDQG